MSQPARADGLLFLGTHGHVVAVDQSDGSIVWKTSLPRTGWDVVVMLVENDRLLCASAGRAFALDPADGRILWRNDLSGLGQGVVAMCTASQANGAAELAAFKAALAARQSSSSGASHG